MTLPVSAAVQADIYDLAFQGFHDVQMMFLPQAWSAAPNMPMTWKQADFPPNPRSDIPKKPGVYVFVVMTDLFGFPHGNALFYIGKATSLNKRIGKYIDDVDVRLLRTQRPLVWRMLNQWNGHLQYFYTITPDLSAAELLESHMIEAFRPPFNRRYEGITSKTMRAFI
jgi:excinuclease UvrABC nuclease subunit